MATTPAQPYGDVTPRKVMQYSAQVVWCIDPQDSDMLFMANALHGKRVAAGDGTKSAIVRGLTPEWPAQATGSNVRLYVVAHGAEVTDDAQTDVEMVVSGTSVSCEMITAEVFFTRLRAFVPQNLKLKRIGLVMCNSAGIQGKVPLDRSFAKLLADRCVDLTVDLTGRMDELNVWMGTKPKSEADKKYLAGQNPFLTHVLDGVPRSVMNARKEVGPSAKTKYRTYIFIPGGKATLKPNYED